MTIFIKTSGGGGIVLIVALALIFGHSGGVGGVLAAVLLGLFVAAMLAVAVTAAVVIRRVLPPRTPDEPLTVIQVAPEAAHTRIGHHAAPAISAPVRLPQDQLEQLAELIRRTERPE